VISDEDDEEEETMVEQTEDEVDKGVFQGVSMGSLKYR
jgi:hypothetical protein